MSDETRAPTFEAPTIEEVAKLFPAYEIHSLIACGGMGAVYFATQLSLDRLHLGMHYKHTDPNFKYKFDNSLPNYCHRQNRNRQ
jgi:hypothetical protein